MTKYGEKVDNLIKAIEHGDESHRKWLRETFTPMIEKFSEEVEDSTVKELGNLDALRAVLKKWHEHLGHAGDYSKTPILNHISDILVQLLIQDHKNYRNRIENSALERAAQEVSGFIKIGPGKSASERIRELKIKESK